MTVIIRQITLSLFFFFLWSQSSLVKIIGIICDCAIVGEGYHHLRINSLEVPTKFQQRSAIYRTLVGALSAEHSGYEH